MVAMVAHIIIGMFIIQAVAHTSEDEGTHLLIFIIGTLQAEWVEQQVAMNTQVHCSAGHGIVAVAQRIVIS